MYILVIFLHHLYRFLPVEPTKLQIYLFLELIIR